MTSRSHARRPAPLSKQHFLADKDTESFATYLATCWGNLDTPHFYRVPARQRRHFCAEVLLGEGWRCTSLKEAAELYSWNGIRLWRTLADGRKLSTDLRSAMARGDEPGTLEQVLAIFEWGGVSKREDRGARPWVKRLATDNALRKTLTELQEIFAADCLAADRFGEHPKLRWDSSMTKVIAFLDRDERFVIYDARVGVALAYLTRLWWQMQRQGSDELPEHLKWPWAPSAGSERRNANPNGDGIQFPRRASKTQHYAPQLAKANAYANWLLSYVVGKLPAEAWRPHPATVSKLRRLEAALFMLGYDVPESA